MDNTIKQMLEDLLGMGGGYVLDFTSREQFASFVQNTLGFDPISRYQGSMAKILRQVWDNEPVADVTSLNLDLLDRRRLVGLKTERMDSPYEEEALIAVTAELKKSDQPKITADELEFLDHDFSSVDLTAVAAELTMRQVIATRLEEVELSLKADAPLAVIFLVGSTLEGLLFDLALAQPAVWVAASTAPKEKGKPKPLDQWRLNDLITVARSLGILSEDVAKHSDQVRNFRNYIHPRQQLKEQFEPRIETARIAYQVLLGTLQDLERITTTPVSTRI